MIFAMKNIIFSILITLLPLSVFSQQVNWQSGGRVTYSLPQKYSAVVGKAAEMFSSDIETATGRKAKNSSNSGILIYQLDRATNREMKALATMHVPVSKFITKKDAFWIGVRSGKVVIVGSNGRGTAYGLLRLSEMPSAIDTGTEELEIPSVEYRGIIMEGAVDKVDYESLFTMMLRLRANTLCEGWDEGEAPSHFLHGLKSLAESYGIALATPHDGNAVRLTEHKGGKTIDITWHDDNYGYMEHVGKDGEHGGAIYHLSYSGIPHDYLWLCTTQPGLLANEMQTAYYNGGDALWLAAVHDPVAAAYHLRLFMDIAWDVNSVKTGKTRQHLSGWLAKNFGSGVADALTEPLSLYFRLVGIRRPEFMDFSRQLASSKGNPNGDGGMRNTEFNAEEFGNELERYLNEYTSVCAKVSGASRLVPEKRKDDFFRMVEYPVYCSALMSVKTLQAQESRLIGRSASFHHDDEALESAVRSIKAYRMIKELSSRYNAISSKSQWNVPVNDAPHGLAVFGPPVLTDTLSDEEMRTYDRYTVVEAPVSDDNTIVRHAYEYTTASSGARRIDLLGRSLRAVDLYNGDTLTYNFPSGVVGGVLRLAFIPTHAFDGGSLQCSVSIDGGQARTVIVTDGSHSDRWADAVLRGQAVVTLPIHLSAGQHTLKIKALSDHVVLDQWMIDKDVDRQFYIFPTKL